MPEPIEDIYLNWLYAKVVDTRVPQSPSNTYRTLIRDLHATEFIWLLSGDDNRAQDGLELRKEFARQMHISPNIPELKLPCSVLEMLIAFSRRATFETEYEEQWWFWTFLDNLGLSELSDATLGVSQVVSEVMDTFIWRTYDTHGNGGLFPLDEPAHDQRKVEIWYQFCEYLVDKDLF